jgi:NADPH-dependent 2,4-dienoyl-CoA reductase/sulfur reductase-like enzyme
MRIVVIGNGVAGIEAAIAVREREPDWDITIVSEESDHFFSRPALMYVAAGQLSHRCIEPYERDLYARLRFRRVRARAVGIGEHEVRLLGDPASLPFDRLLIACGSRARPAPWPGASLAGVGHLVTMQDLEWLERELHGGPGPRGRPPRPDAHLASSAEGSPYRSPDAARTVRGTPPRSPAVIGGGLIGIEAVEVMVAAGLRPRFFIKEEHFWPIALEPREARWIAERMRGHGVEVRLDEEVEALLGAGSVRGVKSDGGEVECDLCVVAIGVVPNTEWLEGSAVERDASGGVVVDDGLSTSLEGVFAAGDCASVSWDDGSRRPEQLWYTARAQGRVAGRRLCGDSSGRNGATYARGGIFNSAKLMDIEYTTAGTLGGVVDGGSGQTFFFEERGEVRSTTRIVTRDDRVIGFNLLGRRWDHSVMLRWIEQRRSLRWVLDHLHEASFDTELVPPLRIPPGVAVAGEAAI